MLAFWSLQRLHCLQPASPLLTPATSQPLQHCSFIPLSKQLLPFDSSRPGPAVTPQPAFLGSGFPRSSRDGCRLSGMRSPGWERCWRRGWRERIPAGHSAGDAAGQAATGKQTGSQLGGYKASCGLPGSYKSAPPSGQGRDTLRACEPCSRGFGDLLLSPWHVDGVCHNQHLLWRKRKWN